MQTIETYRATDGWYFRLNNEEPVGPWLDEAEARDFAELEADEQDAREALR